jgi:hypothetical protein
LVSLRATCFQILGRTSSACALVALTVAVFAVTASPAPAAPASVNVSFKWLPTVPVAGQAVTFTSTSTVTGYTIQSQRWDLDDNGTFGDQAGASVQTSLPSAGGHSVALQVVTVDKHGAVQNHVHTEVVSVQPSPNKSPVASFATTRLLLRPGTPSASIPPPLIPIRRSRARAGTSMGTGLMETQAVQPHHARSGRPVRIKLGFKSRTPTVRCRSYRRR